MLSASKLSPPGSPIPSRFLISPRRTPLTNPASLARPRDFIAWTVSFTAAESGTRSIKSIWYAPQRMAISAMGSGFLPGLLRHREI